MGFLVNSIILKGAPVPLNSLYALIIDKQVHFWPTGQIKYKPEGKLINVEEANLDAIAMSRFLTCFSSRSIFVENKCIESLVNRNRDELMMLDAVFRRKILDTRSRIQI